MQAVRARGAGADGAVLAPTCSSARSQHPAWGPKRPSSTDRMDRRERLPKKRIDHPQRPRARRDALARIPLAPCRPSPCCCQYVPFSVAQTIAHYPNTDQTRLHPGVLRRQDRLVSKTVRRESVAGVRISPLRFDSPQSRMSAGIAGYGVAVRASVFVRVSLLFSVESCARTAPSHARSRLADLGHAELEMSADRLAEFGRRPPRAQRARPRAGPEHPRRGSASEAGEEAGALPAAHRQDNPATSRPVRRFASSGFDGGARPTVARPAEPEKNRAEVILGLARLRALNTVRRPA